MKKLLLIIVLTLSTLSCAAVTPQTIQTGVTVAQGLLDLVQELLDWADSSKLRSNCDRYTVEDTEIRDRAIAECTDINDATMYLREIRSEYLMEPTKANEDMLRQAAAELESVLRSSGVAQ